MFKYQGKTVLITGASSGIGEAFANALAAKGSNLILVARSEAKLRALATKLSTQHGVRVEVMPADLSQTQAVEELGQAVQGRRLQVDVLINNAGFATYGPFETVDRNRQHEEVLLNVAAVLDLTHIFLTAMLARGDGAIINVASTAAFQPDPYLAVYGATKAFVLSFSEALWAENHKRGVKVLALCPGATQTAFFDVVGAEEASVGRRFTPERVVKAGLKALEQGRSHVIPGKSNYLLAQLSRFLPRQRTAKIVEQTLRPRTNAVSVSSDR